MLDRNPAIKVCSAVSLNPPRSKTVMVVEDEFLVAVLLCADLEGDGYSVSGPFSTNEAAFGALRDRRIDGAVLDINLNGQMIYPLARELARQGIPFIFVSGYSASDIPEEFRRYPRLAKPTDNQRVLKELATLLAERDEEEVLLRSPSSRSGPFST